MVDSGLEPEIRIVQAFRCTVESRTTPADVPTPFDVKLRLQVCFTEVPLRHQQPGVVFTAEAKVDQPLCNLLTPDCQHPDGCSGSSAIHVYLCSPLFAETEQATPADTLLHNASSKAERFDGRAFRRTLGKSGKYIRNPVNDKASLALMETHGVGYSTTGLVAQMRESGNLWQFKGITVKLANAYGYCWGVERAVQMAYEARKAYPGQKLYVTNEIIHNPAVNQVYSSTVSTCSIDASTE